MIQILFENGENNLWLQKYLDMCGQNIDRHIKMTCHGFAENPLLNA